MLMICQDVIQAWVTMVRQILLWRNYNECNNNKLLRSEVPNLWIVAHYQAIAYLQTGCVISGPVRACATLLSRMAGWCAHTQVHTSQLVTSWAMCTCTPACYWHESGCTHASTPLSIPVLLHLSWTTKLHSLGTIGLDTNCSSQILYHLL